MNYLATMSGKNFLERLQESDERTKRWWLIVCSCAAMGVVLFIWLRYFSALVNTGGEQMAAGSDQGSGSMSFAETMRAGAGVLFDRVKGAVSRFGEVIQAPRSYDITPPQ